MVRFFVLVLTAVFFLVPSSHAESIDLLKNQVKALEAANEATITENKQLKRKIEKLVTENSKMIALVEYQDIKRCTDDLEQFKRNTEQLTIINNKWDAACAEKCSIE